MLDAVWLLAAIELNGAMISRGAQVQLTPDHCRVEASAIAPALSTEQQDTIEDDAWETDPQQCHFLEAEQVLQIELPQHYLATKTLTLGEPSSTMSVAFLHSADTPHASTRNASAPIARTIPSAALDVFLGSGLHGLGTVLANGPWSVQGLYQQSSSGPPLRRTSAEYLSVNGGQLRAGDFRTDHGPEQSFGEYRGVLITNRAPPLRGEGKAETELVIHSPSRVQFFDRNGVPVYASEILPPGNYQVQGFGASAIPGFLEARLVDVNGIYQSVSLPWSADRRLLASGQAEWEMFAGQPRGVEGTLANTPLYSARIKYGLHHSLTGGLHAEQSGDRFRGAIELSSRAVPSLIASAAFGQACSSAGCEATWLAEARATLGKGVHALASTGKTLVLGQRPPAPPTPPGVPIEQAQQIPPIQQAAQMSLTGAWSSSLSGSIHWATTRLALGAAQSVWTLAGHVRLSPESSVVVQARHHLLNNDHSSWSGFVGLTYQFAKERTSVSSYATVRSSPSGSIDHGTTFQANMASPGLYGPQLSLAHAQEGVPRSDGFFRYASPYGDLSLRADTVSRHAAWSASTRLWVTQEGFILTPAGDDNLVIQKLGLAQVRIQHSGRDTQASDHKGTAVFKKAPAWTDSTYTIDAKSIPFGVHLSSSRMRMPLASNRAYLVDYRGLWSQSRSWRIPVASLPQPQAAGVARDRQGRAIHITADGFADLRSAEDLPLVLLGPQGRKLECHADALAAEDSWTGGETLLSCMATVDL